MATTAAAADGPSMKLQIVVDKKHNRVIFAEAKKNFVDFIFHILSLPLGVVHRILTDTSASLGSIGVLYDGFKNLGDQYLEDPAKDYLLKHLQAPYWGKNTTLLLPGASSSNPRRFYQCNRDRIVRVDMLCSHQSPSFCSPEVNVDILKRDMAAVRGNEMGYVKELVTYMVMDDLAVRPAEPVFVVSLMNEHSIIDVRDIEKREVTIGTAEAIKLLKASISSKTVLTDVFLGGVVKTEN